MPEEGMTNKQKRTHKAQMQQQRQLEKLERHSQALELRKAGATYQQIGDAMGVNLETARRWVKQAMEGLIREPAEELRQLQMERLNTMLMVIWQEVRQGNLPAIDRALRIMGDQRALMGLDQVKVEKKEEVRVQINTSPDDYITALREIREAQEAAQRAALQEAQGGEVIDAVVVEETVTENP